MLCQVILLAFEGGFLRVLTEIFRSETACLLSTQKSNVNRSRLNSPPISAKMTIISRKLCTISPI